MTHLSIYNPIIFHNLSVLHILGCCYWRDSVDITVPNHCNFLFFILALAWRGSECYLACWVYCTGLNILRQQHTLFTSSSISDYWKSIHEHFHLWYPSLPGGNIHQLIWQGISDLHHDKFCNFPMLFYQLYSPWSLSQASKPPLSSII